MNRQRIIILISLIVLDAVLLFANFQYQDSFLQKGLFTSLALTAVYLVFEILLSEFVIKRVKDSKTRYSFRKILSVLSLVIFIIIFLSIWLAETQNILIALGLIGAAIAFAIQDIFKNFLGGVLIFLNGIYSVGDRIEMGDKHGDVIDIGIFYTTLMETRGWVSGDQVTGRLTVVPNGGVLMGTVHNYTRDFDFIWDEITLPITYDSDWNEATRLIHDIIKKETDEVAINAQKTMERIEGKYYFTKRSLEPAIFLTLTDNWITFGVRYVAEVRTRRVLHDRLTRIILGEFEKSDKITIASTTINIVGFPPIDLEHKPND